MCYTMSTDEMEYVRQRITELKNRVSTIEEQMQRDPQLLAAHQRRIDDLERRLTEMELEPPTTEPLE